MLYERKAHEDDGRNSKKTDRGPKYCRWNVFYFN